MTTLLCLATFLLVLLLAWDKVKTVALEGALEVKGLALGLFAKVKGLFAKKA